MTSQAYLALLAGLLAGIVNSLLSASDVSRDGAGQHPLREPLPYGHPDFVPTADRPIGYRGDGTGHFPGATPPLTFSEKDGKNVRWSLKLPGWSQSSPIVVGKSVITAAEPDTTLCVDADTGKVLWQDALGVFEKDDWRKSGGYVFLWSGYGYSWPCSDGERVAKAWIGAKGAAALVCYDVKTGKRMWMWQFSGDHQKHKFTFEGGRWAWRRDAGAIQHSSYGPSGYGSPQLYDDLVIYHAKGLGCALVALDKQSGALRWVSKPNVTGNGGSDVNFLIFTVAGRRVLVTDIGTVLDPKTGAVLGEAIPSLEKDGRTFSRLWGLVEKGPKGEVKVAGVTPATDGGTDGLLAFGPDWPRVNNKDELWDQVPPAPGKGSCYCYLAVRLGFDAEGQLTTSLVFPDRAVVPKLEYGNAHLTLVKNHLVVMPGYGNTLAAITLDTGKMAFPVKGLWNKQPPFRGREAPNPAPDASDPKTRAALDEFGLTVRTVTEFNRGIGRNGDSSYSRTFVDGSGCIWYMNRQARLYRIDPAHDFASELAGSLDHPTVWTSCSSPFPHGNRIYVRTFGRLACIGEK